jgi:hypothetical protein
VYVGTTSRVLLATDEDRGSPASVGVSTKVLFWPLVSHPWTVIVSAGFADFDLD